MKKTYLMIIFIAGLFFSTNAQFLMKSETHILKTGDEHYFNITNNVDEGPVGGSQTWDYSKIETQSQLTSYMYDASITPNSIDIPNANTVLEEFGTKFYFKTSGNIIEQYGTVSANNTITKYDKPFVKMIFPFEYGDVYSGNFSGTIEGNNSIQPFEGSYLLEADAYGTLILPTGIYDNVIRIKTVKEQRFNNSKCNCSIVSYKWYSKDIRYPLLTIIKSQSNEGSKTIQTAYYSKYKLNESPENEKVEFENISATIYPNPFGENFNVDYLIKNDCEVEIQIFDTSGKKVYTSQKQAQKAGFYTKTIGREQLGDQLGIYYIRIDAGNESVLKTVIRSGE